MTKHHGLGNDFLVLVDPEDHQRLSPAEVEALCDRHRGVGADGLIRVLAGREGADISMELSNSDGSVADMSGNGIRCAAQAALDAGLVGGHTFVAWTRSGLRSLEVIGAPGGGTPDEGPTSLEVRVGMGAPVVGPEGGPVAGRRARPVRVGNSHLVLLEGDPAEADLALVAREVAEAEHGEVNVELVSVGPGRDELTIRTWERGAGETLACGTGSVAAAAAALDWGLVGGRVRVRNPGGALEVDLAGGEALLSGPTERVARVEVARP